MRFAILAVACLLLAGCPLDTKRTMPHETLVTVVKFKPLPAWAVEQVANDPPVDGKVASLRTADQKRADALDYVNCRSRLLETIDKGANPTDAAECKK